jgi:hypothetical protein
MKYFDSISKKLTSAANIVTRWCPDYPYYNAQDRAAAALMDAHSAFTDAASTEDRTRLKKVFETVSSISHQLAAIPNGSRAYCRDAAVWKLNRACNLMRKAMT